MQNGQSLPLPRCPHCNVAKPSLNNLGGANTTDDRGTNERWWNMYKCAICGGVTLAVAPFKDVNRRIQGPITHIWPEPRMVHDSLPERAKAYLQQAIASIAAPAGAVILAASAVDSMLKEKGLKGGSLHKRIEEAAAQHLITAEMAEWAHEVRLDANDQRHADEDGALPDEADAHRSIEFATALAQFLFVLPSLVAQGRAR
ncbi:DUF4145 domain-containing protein [Pseudomonas synxantha]|uniref:DUF4145 domain-containing protein n=1 Tax=Pseudomonas synxantha TaxID=47883 RepID=UPI000F56C386|nr:DUF4145 domain-containing protein [Pseudomonas synxantha]AZE76134.1 hypothetical protein C4J99_0317 [Pseudomonas synxantha]